MKNFLYKATDVKGQVITGSVKANNDLEAEEILMRHKLSIIDLSPEKQMQLQLKFFKGRVSSKDKAIFARQLSTMISAGLELAKAIKVTSGQARNDNIRQVYLDIYKELEDGNSFSASLAKHPEVFDPVFVSVVNAGEATGKLDIVLKQLADQLENDNNFAGKIKGAMYYPAFILVALLGIGTYMLVKVIPQIKGLFDQSGAQLPLATRMLLAISDFMTKDWWAVLIIVIGIVAFLKFWSSSEMGGKTIDQMQLRIPGIKGLYENMYMYRFAQIMSMLVGTGVPLLEALKIGGTTMNNSVLENSIAKIISQVEKGVPLSVQLSKDPIFPPLIGQMAAVGEETGQLDSVFDKVADYYEQETEQLIRTVSTLVEPIIIVIMGCAVAFIVFAVLVPIYQISNLNG